MVGFINERRDPAQLIKSMMGKKKWQAFKRKAKLREVKYKTNEEESSYKKRR